MEFDADDLELEPTKSVQKKRPRRNSDISVGTAHLSTPRTSSRQGVQPTPDRTPSTRRSQRGKNIDVSRPMLLVMPDTNVRDKLDIRSDFEFEQFLAAMDEDNSGDWSDGDEGSVGGHHEPSVSAPSANSLKMEVITPSVRATNSGIPQVTSHFDFDLKKDKRGATSSSSSSGARINHDNYSMIPSLHENPFDQLYQYAPYAQYYDGYFDYDCNEDDMNFLDTMKQRLLSTNTFENYHLQKEFLTSMNEIMNYRLVELMFQRLEKELELMITQYDYNKDCSNYYKNLKTSLYTIEQLFDDKFFNDVLQTKKEKNNDDDGESAARTAQVEENIPSVDRNEDKVEDDEDDSDGNSAEEITERLMSWLKGNEVFDTSSNNNNAFYRGRTDSTVSLPDLLQSSSNASINGLPSNLVLPTHLNTGSTSALPTPSSGKHLDKSCENQIKRPKFNQKDLENYFQKDRRYIKLLLPIIHRYIIDKNPFKYYNTNNNGTNSGSNNSGMSSMMMMNKTPYKQLIGGEIEIDWNLLDPKYYHTIELFCLEIVNYYINIRCNDKQSLLRGYHTFIMPLWQRCHEGNTIPYYRDYSKESFLYSYKQLQVIRNDLNRARLIIDRVRRREKMKKELLRCCNDHLLQNVLQLPPINNHPNLSTLMMMNDITLPPGLTSASLDAINNTLASSSSLHRMNRSLSFVSEGGLSVDGGNMTTMPRKRGRPRRIFPTSGSSSMNDKKNIHGLDDASLGVMASSHFSTSGNSNNNVPIIVKYVQGRDKNGKFLKKAPIIIGAAATTTVTTSHIISGSNNSHSSLISCSNSSQQQVNNSTNNSNSSSFSNQANVSTENTNTATLLPSSACSSSSTLSNQPGTSLQDNIAGNNNSCLDESKDSINSSVGKDIKIQNEKLEAVVNSEHIHDLSVTAPTEVSVSYATNPLFPKVSTTNQYLNPNRDVTVPAISFSIHSTDNDHCENEMIVTAPANDSHDKQEEMSSNQRKKSKKDMKVRIKQEHQYDSEEGTTMSCHSSESISLLSLSSQRDTASNVY